MPFPQDRTASSPSARAAELRGQISQLRRELVRITADYHSAKATGDHTQVILLLRKRTHFVRQLFQTQSELLLLFRTDENRLALQDKNQATTSATGSKTGHTEPAGAVP
jgi:hypothetical protein